MKYLTVGLILANLISTSNCLWSMGACLPFPDSGFNDQAIDTNNFGTGKWMAAHRTHLMLDSLYGDCSHSYFKYENDMLQEYRLQWFVYYFF